ncbi:MAG: hypothetical protein ACXWMF_05395 [Syntrophales bacterium]
MYDIGEIFRLASPGTMLAISQLSAYYMKEFRSAVSPFVEREL